MYICTIPSLSISVDGHLGCYHVLAVVNNAGMNTGVHVSFWIIVFSGFIPSSGITQSHGSSIFSFLRISMLFLQFFFNLKGSLWIQLARPGVWYQFYVQSLRLIWWTETQWRLDILKNHKGDAKGKQKWSYSLNH